MNSTSILVAKNLSAGYPGKVIWENANFEIGKGEFVGILGPNGAGKTTLLRLLLGLIQPLSGQIQLFGDNPHRGNRRVGYVPQRRPIDSEMTIEALEIVRLGIRGNRWGFSNESQAREERASALAALKSVDALELAHQPIGILSGGELQRIFIAQALVGDIDILLLDEPLANLDVRRENELVQIIKNVVRKKNITVLLIAHDLNPLLPTLDRVIYIANKKVATGSVQQIVTSKSLSDLYGAPIEVLRDSKGRVAILGIEEVAHHE